MHRYQTATTVRADAISIVQTMQMTVSCVGNAILKCKDDKLGACIWSLIFYGFYFQCVYGWGFQLSIQLSACKHKLDTITVVNNGYQNNFIFMQPT